MASHTTDWHPGRVSNDFRQGWDRIFGDAKTDDEQVKAALKFFKQDCCASGCDCSNRKPKQEESYVPGSNPSTGLNICKGSESVRSPLEGAFRAPDGAVRNHQA